MINSDGAARAWQPAHPTLALPTAGGVSPGPSRDDGWEAQGKERPSHCHPPLVWLPGCWPCRVAWGWAWGEAPSPAGSGDLRPAPCAPCRPRASPGPPAHPALSPVMPAAPELWLSLGLAAKPGELCALLALPGPPFSRLSPAACFLADKTGGHLRWRCQPLCLSPCHPRRPRALRGLSARHTATSTAGLHRGAEWMQDIDSKGLSSSPLESS